MGAELMHTGFVTKIVEGLSWTERAGQFQDCWGQVWALTC